jgi:hypothetical protein
MRRKRLALRANDFTQCKLTIPHSLYERLRGYKASYKLRSIEVVVSAILRKGMAAYKPGDLVLAPPPQPDDPPKTIAVHIPRQQYAYMEAVATHFRNVTLGVALETVAAVVTDLTPAPTQLSLIEEKP